MHHSGYEANDRLLLGASGVASVLFAPFACHQLHIAAVTAAIATSGEIPPRQEPAIYVLRTMTGWRVTQEKIRHTTPEPTEMAHTHDAASWGDRSAAIAASRVTRRGPAYEMATAMNPAGHDGRRRGVPPQIRAPYIAAGS